MNPLPKAKCPTCKKEGDWFAGLYGPFCSHRCKLIDLGKWFSQENAISEPLRPEHLEKYADLPPGEHLDRTEAEEKGMASSETAFTHRTTAPWAACPADGPRSGDSG